MQKRAVDVAVLSDLHLGTYGSRAAEALSYLRSIAPRLLVLNGDIIDVWQFSKHYFPPAHMAVIKEIFQLLSNGTRVIYITGNHDEMLRRYTDLQLGNLQLADKALIEIDNKMTWIFHGDVFDNTTQGSARFWARLGSNGYAILLGFKRQVNRLLTLLGRERVSFSKRVMAQVNRSIVKIDRFEKLVANLAIEKKYDCVICGHTHQPHKRVVETEKGSVLYLNSGDWIEHLTALEYYERDWHLYTYDETLNEPTPPREGISPMATTDEISMCLHTLNL